MPEHHKMIAKGCLKCEQLVAVDCKACPCGYSCFKAKRAHTSPLPINDIRRHTQREKPNYYDSLEYDRQIKNAKLHNCECEDEGKRDPKKSKRGRWKTEKEEDDDPLTPLTLRNSCDWDPFPTILTVLEMEET